MDKFLAGAAVAVMASGAFFYQRQRTASSSCCPPESLGSLNAQEAGATTEPTGIELIIPGSTMRCYIAHAPSTPIGVIILFHDIFGISSGRTRHVADEIASWGYTVVCPDFFDDFDNLLGDGNDLTLWKRPWRFLPGANQFFKRARLSFDHFVQQRLDTVILPYIDKLVEGKKKKLGMMGFCWGGWAITRCASFKDVFACGVGAHPSPDVQRLQQKGPSCQEMYQQVKCPLLYLPAWNDPAWLKPNGSAIQAIQHVSPDSRSVDFPQMTHGWVNRGDIRNPLVKQHVDLAMQLTKDFFALHMN